MAFAKALIFTGLVAVIAAQSLQQDYSAPAKYSFQYNVADPHTGDQKEQQEERDGDTVRGFYTVVEPDGTLRRVDYTADDEHGFQAVVTKQAGAAHPVPVTRTVVAQPAAVHVVSHQPAVHVVSQPAAHYAYQAPVVHAVHAAPVTSHIIQAAPLTSQIVHHAPVTSQVVHHAPVVSSIPQFVRTVSAPVNTQYVYHK